MPRIETSKLAEFYSTQTVDKDCDSSLLTPPANYKGPAFLRSDTCLIPIIIIKNLGTLEEKNSKGSEIQMFGAVLNSSDLDMRKRIQGGVRADRVGVKPSAIERFLLDGVITEDENTCDKLSLKINESRGFESSLVDIPEGYHGHAVLLVDETCVPIYVGGIGEETGKGHARARLNLGKKQIRLEGEIEASRVKARPSDIILFEEKQRTWDYKNR